MNSMFYLVPALGLIGLVVMFFHYNWVSKQDAGDENMKRLSGYIADGALAFLKAEWKVLIIFSIPVAALLAWSGTRVETSDWLIGISFLVGAFASALAGYIGMNIATKANVRTTQAARTSLAKALNVSFRGGMVMGLGVAGLAVIGLGGLFILFYNMYVSGAAAGDVNGIGMEQALEVLAGFSLGAESIALFARVGGGIYTKAADVGADLVGKVEAGIPEDDPRNPATIADNVGDNVGDVAGMGADLFGSFVATILATMVLGREVVSEVGMDNFGGIAPILLPLVIAGVGLIFSAISGFFVRVKSETSSVMTALNIGNWGSMVLTLIASFFIVGHIMPEGEMVVRGITFDKMDVFYCILTGLI
ncbi:MAG: sodium/proton-translocating pyrophosphatase, partial [Bacteroidia bacterium]